MTGPSDYAARIAKRNAEVVRLYEAGTTRPEIARLVGVCLSVVGSILREHRQTREIEVPGWVLDEHREDYVQIAREDGEEAAASYARRAKRGPVLHLGPCEHGVR